MKRDPLAANRQRDKISVPLKRLLGVAALVLVLAGGLLLSGSPPQEATTNPPYKSMGPPPLMPHVYDMPPEQTRQVVGAVGATVLGWHVMNSDPANGTIELEAPARLGLAKDEITATVRPEGRNAAVSIVSRANYRGFDWGANEKHVRDLQAAMDQQLPQGH